MAHSAESSECSFTVKKYEGGIPWIMVEMHAPGLNVLKMGFLKFALPDGTTMNETQKTANELNERITKIGFTSLA